MAEDTTNYPREFMYGNVTIADPDKTLSPEKVVEHLSINGYSNMTTATVDGPKVVGNKNVYTIDAKPKTKA